METNAFLNITITINPQKIINDDTSGLWRYTVLFSSGILFEVFFVQINRKFKKKTASF